MFLSMSFKDLETNEVMDAMVNFDQIRMIMKGKNGNVIMIFDNKVTFHFIDDYDELYQLIMNKQFKLRVADKIDSTKH